MVFTNRLKKYCVISLPLEWNKGHSLFVSYYSLGIRAFSDRAKIEILIGSMLLSELSFVGGRDQHLLPVPSIKRWGNKPKLSSFFIYFVSFDCSTFHEFQCEVLPSLTHQMYISILVRITRSIVGTTWLIIRQILLRLIWFFYI